MDFKDNPEDFDIKRAIDALKRSYIERALKKENNLTSAAKLLNLCDDNVRLPLVKVTDPTKEIVKKALLTAKLI